MIVEMLLLVLIGVAVFAFVVAPVVMSGRRATSSDDAVQSVPADEVRSITMEQNGARVESERHQEQKQPVRDAP